MNRVLSDPGDTSPNSSSFKELRSRRGLPPLKVAIPHVTVISASTSSDHPRRYHFESDLSPDAQQSFNVAQTLDAITQCLDRIDQQ